MYSRTMVFLAAAAVSLHGGAFFLEDLPEPQRRASIGELKFSGDAISASRKTGEMSAKGNVKAEAGPYRFFSDSLTRSAEGVYDLGEKAMMTTCDHELDDLHWKIEGHFTYETDKSITGSDMWLYLMECPVLWFPWAYYPLNTDYGFRFLPGYTSRWGCYFLAGYVYDIYRESSPDGFGLGGSTYFNWRQKNGVEVGQTVRWRFGEYGNGKLKGFYAWDDDYDRYNRHWVDSHLYNYRNWGSEVHRERYRVSLQHRSDFTERDSLNVVAQYLSDSHYLRDFARKDYRHESMPVNEAWYEHRENAWAAGATVSGPVNEFYGGTARLPEVWLSVEPQPVFALPVNYESQTRAGCLDRQYAKYGAEDPVYRYSPYIGANGRGADYQAFRADTSHRLSIPFMIADLVSVVPRVGYRATWWSDSGNPDSLWLSAAGNSMYRGIVEAGFSASTRAQADFGERWQHVFEPYADYSFQEVSFGGGRKNRYYSFDNYDRSFDWLDQFGFEGRGLPYNWHGVRPGVRNYIRKREEGGTSRAFLETDLYAAVPFRDDSRFTDGPLAGYPRKDANGNYSRNECVVPGFMVRFNPSNRFSFSTRTEFDIDEEQVAYSDVNVTHRVTESFSWHAGYIGRDHRIWDYLPSERDRWNWQYSNIVRFGFRHRVCDWFEWAPFVRWDARCNELDETGAWFDILTDCLGFRFSVDYENAVRRIDGSKQDGDLEFGFAIYLRALGAGSMLDLAKF